MIDPEEFHRLSMEVNRAREEFTALQKRADELTTLIDSAQENLNDAKVAFSNYVNACSACAA